MKTKIIRGLLCTILVAVVITLGGCKLFEPPTPTKDDVINDLKISWDVNLPENIVLRNYSLSVGMRDYSLLYVFEYGDKEEKFIQQLSSEKNIEVEKFFKDICERRKDTFNKEYTMPEIPDNYYWLHRYKAEGNLITLELYILYLPNENQILVYNFKL